MHFRHKPCSADHCSFQTAQMGRSWWCHPSTTQKAWASSHKKRPQHPLWWWQAGDTTNTTTTHGQGAQQHTLWWNTHHGWLMQTSVMTTRWIHEMCIVHSVVPNEQHRLWWVWAKWHGRESHKCIVTTLTTMHGVLHTKSLRTQQTDSASVARESQWMKCTLSADSWNHCGQSLHKQTDSLWMTLTPQAQHPFLEGTLFQPPFRIRKDKWFDMRFSVVMHQSCEMRGVERHQGQSPQFGCDNWRRRALQAHSQGLVSIANHQHYLPPPWRCQALHRWSSQKPNEEFFGTQSHRNWVVRTNDCFCFLFGLKHFSQTEQQTKQGTERRRKWKEKRNPQNKGIVMEWCSQQKSKRKGMRMNKRRRKLFRLLKKNAGFMTMLIRRQLLRSAANLRKGQKRIKKEQEHSLKRISRESEGFTNIVLTTIHLFVESHTLTWNVCSELADGVVITNLKHFFITDENVFLHKTGKQIGHEMNMFGCQWLDLSGFPLTPWMIAQWYWWLIMSLQKTKQKTKT